MKVIPLCQARHAHTTRDADEVHCGHVHHTTHARGLTAMVDGASSSPKTSTDRKDHTERECVDVSGRDGRAREQTCTHFFSAIASSSLNTRMASFTIPRSSPTSMVARCPLSRKGTSKVCQRILARSTTRKQQKGGPLLEFRTSQKNSKACEELACSAAVGVLVCTRPRRS